MAKNDYRRELIMFRQLSGDSTSGFARLEQYTLRGTLQFTVSGFRSGNVDTLKGFIATKDGRGYKFTEAGGLRVDSRGQAGTLFEFDPRLVNGAPFETYSAIGVVQVDKDEVRIPLAGNLFKGAHVDYAELSEAARRWAESLKPAKPVETARSEPKPVTEFVTEREPVIEPEPVEEPEPVVESEATIDFEEIIEFVPEEIEPEASLEEEEITEQKYSEPRVTENARQQAVDFDDFLEEIQDPVPDLMLESLSETINAPIITPDKPEKASPKCDIIWPGASAALQALFEHNAEFEPFDAPGFKFIRVALPEASGISHCGIGVREQGGSAHTLCYAIPGANGAFPPAGLEGYQYRQGVSGGYWVVYQDALTGDTIDSAYAEEFCD